MLLTESKVDFTRLNKYPVLLQGRTYKNELSPRIALQKKIKINNAVFASISPFEKPQPAEYPSKISTVVKNMEPKQPP